MEAKKKKTPQPLLPIVSNIWGVKREMMKFQNQLLAGPLLASVKYVEVIQGMLTCCRGLTQATSVHVEHFGVDDPRGTVPRWRVEGCPQVLSNSQNLHGFANMMVAYEEEHGSNATAAQAAGGLRHIPSGNVATDNPHADGTASSTNDEQVPSSEVVNEEEHPHKGQDSLDDAKDTSGEEASVGPGDTNGCETC